MRLLSEKLGKKGVAGLGLAICGGAALLLFQNCGGFQSFNERSQARVSSSTTEPVMNGVLADPSVLTIEFTNTTREFSKRFTATATSAPDSIFEILNTKSGRKVSVQILLDPVTRAITRVQPIGQAYFCLDPNRPACDLVKIPAGYDYAGLSQMNCSSPIFYTGALTGSLNNITEAVVCTYPQTLLSVTNINNEAIGSFNSTTTAETQPIYVVTNPISGRKASLRITIDPDTRAIKAVQATGQPYFCYDPAAGPCAAMTVPTGYSFAGTVQPNCSSPIGYTGALVGKVGQQSTEVQCAALTAR